ncbi:MAG: tyrosine-type recombinase/integrase [Blastocatellia bacterium]
MANEGKGTLDQNGSTNPSLISNKKRKRGQGEGTIYKRKDGRWAAAINLGYQNGRLRRKTFYGTTRKAVSDQLMAALRKQQQGLPLVGETQTVKQFLENWLENIVKPSTRPATYISYRHMINLHVVPELGHIRLAKLTPQHCQQMVKNLMAKNSQSRRKDGERKLLSNRTVQYCLTVLRMALKKAETWGLVARNVGLLADPPKVERHEVKPMDPNEARKFLELIKGDRLEAFFRVGLALGLRRGEALALKWSDIDFEGSMLRVSGTL